MGKRIYNLDFFIKLAIEKGGECLSSEYISCDKKLQFKCNMEHVWETKPYYLVNNKSWCPDCNKSAKDNNTQLIRIPYTIKNIEEYLNKALKTILILK